MSRPSSASDTPVSGFYKLPPIITTEADREFLSDVNSFIDAELSKVNHLDEEQRYLIYKAVFNRVIEHVTAYKPVLTLIKKEYEDTIETIKKGQREAAFLQGKLKAMASEPSTLRNYKKRADELEERMAVVKKDNERLVKELKEIQAARVEREKRPKTAEAPKRQLKKDSRLIPGLTLEETTDMQILQRKYESLDRQLKELNISLRARFLPKTQKLELKETLDNKVAYRDDLLWQSQVYKARGHKLKIALEASQAYNQMKPPHQTVGDAVMIAFQQASGMLRAERERAEGEQVETAQATFEDDDPNKEKEAEMMLEYIEKFNELFEDGQFEEAAVHAANSPKGILRTQATLAKFRDVKTKTKGRSPLLAFCDAMMSSVKAAGSKPNEALSMDCMAAGLKENRLDLAYHWLAQERLTLSHGLGQMITEHCSCPLPCKCGCQALAQNVFVRLKSHVEVLLTMLKQGKVQAAVQHGRLSGCVTGENLGRLLETDLCQELVEGLMEAEPGGGKSLFAISLGQMLGVLQEMKRPEVAGRLIQAMLHSKPTGAGSSDSPAVLLSLDKAVCDDQLTTSGQWMDIVEWLTSEGQPEAGLQFLAMTTVVETMMKAWTIASEEKRAVSFSHDVQVKSDSDVNGDDEDNNDDEDDEESSCGMSSRSPESTSFDRSSRESSPDLVVAKKPPKGSILKKKLAVSGREGDSSVDTSPRKSPAPPRRKGGRVAMLKSPPPQQVKEEAEVSPHKEIQNLKVPSKGGIRQKENDPSTSNPESAGESEAE
ncbi:clathrin heavy chain linker domain-containing protein 1 [Aplysia californica]|uniref:Clathrin heavy chain linker domain-containing protein 1 n=1 Tax=Aplysia californica TaxID=6500 RepID=A0ABM1A7A9_APLCA|nr:clathrin heavy chain linker domain-containing protein 1 [Aplysia californica]